MISSACDDVEGKGRNDPSVKKTYHNGLELLENFDTIENNFSYMSESLLGGKGTNSNGCIGNVAMPPNQHIVVNE